MSAALILIDLQKDFFRIEYEDQELANRVKRELTEHINRLLDESREHHIPVFFVVTSYKADGSDRNLRMKDIGASFCMEGTEGQELIPGIKTTCADHFILKTRYSAFHNTTLHKELQSRGIDTLIIGGINTHACIRTSAVDAFMRDYRVFIPNECVASYDPAYHETTLDYISKRIGMVLNLKEMVHRLNLDDLSFHFGENEGE